jgi:hypothetical protein
MSFGVASFLKSLDKDLLKKAEKCKVRECEEDGNGNLVAFVEQGKQDMDVLLTFSGKDKLISHQCDCGDSKTVCLHKVAVMLHWTQQKTGSKTPSKRVSAPKKKSPLEQSLEQVDPGELKAWLLEMLSKNKGLNLMFMNRFVDKQEELTVAQVQTKLKNVVKLVINSRTKVEASEIKRIVELWEVEMKPLQERYLRNVLDPEAFELIKTMHKTVIDIVWNWRNHPKQVNVFLTRFQTKALKAIFDLPVPATRKEALAAWTEVAKESNPERDLYRGSLLKIIPELDPETRIFVIERLVKDLKYKDAYRASLDWDFEESVFFLVAESGLFPKYVHVFKPHHHTPDYNIRLVELLVEAGELDRAEKVCWEVIGKNLHDHYNIPFYESLKQLYKIKPSEKKILELKSQTIYLDFDMEDFLFVFDRRSPEDDQKKFRKQFLAAARNNKSIEAKRFCLELMRRENKIPKLLEYMDENTHNSLIVEFGEDLHKSLGIKFLLHILIVDISRVYSWNFSKQVGEPGLVADAILRWYSKEEIKEGLKLFSNHPKSVSYRRMPGEGHIKKALQEAMK